MGNDKSKSFFTGVSERSSDMTRKINTSAKAEVTIDQIFYFNFDLKKKKRFFEKNLSQK